MNRGHLHHIQDMLPPMYFALATDILMGDPPNRYHPVAWMGRGIERLRPRRDLPPLPALLRGALILGGGSLLSAMVGYTWQRLAQHLPSLLRWGAVGLVWKQTLALRGLIQAAMEVHRALDAGDLSQARHLVAWHLVSRDTHDLDTSLLTAATIESLAENLSDGVIAPLCFGLVGGLPAALVYRYINTADAMLGYRTPTYEWVGKVPARCDDIANLLPARISALLIVIAAALLGENAGNAWQVLRRDAHHTASPNAGYPMSAMAGALGIELVKVGHYHLGRGGRPPQPDDILRAVRLVWGAVTIAVGLITLGAILRSPRGRQTWRQNI